MFLVVLSYSFTVCLYGGKSWKLMTCCIQELFLTQALKQVALSGNQVLRDSRHGLGSLTKTPAGLAAQAAQAPGPQNSMERPETLHGFANQCQNTGHN
eukprot:s637_g33.t1